jgi:hypothetical protein
MPLATWSSAVRPDADTGAVAVCGRIVLAESADEAVSSLSWLFRVLSVERRGSVVGVGIGGG